MDIEFCVFCHNFQKRLCWQLSSINQQIGGPQVTINLASMADEGTPSTEEVVEYYRGIGMRIKYLKYNVLEDIALRGIVRNRQLEEVDCTYVFFADCDHVYSPNFFRDLWQAVQHQGYTEKVMYALPRIYTTTESANDLVDNHSGIYIDDAHTKASELPVWKIPDSHIAGGGMQVALMEAVDKRVGRVYCPPDECPDRHLFKKGQKARSDLVFRRAMRHPKLFHIQNQIHLSHTRDADFKKHLTEQR